MGGILKLVHSFTLYPDATLAQASALPLAQQRALVTRAFSPRPPGGHGQQPDLHHHHRAGAAGHGDAGRLQRLPDVLELPGGAGALLPAEPGARHHRGVRGGGCPLLQRGDPGDICRIVADPRRQTI